MNDIGLLPQLGLSRPPTSLTCRYPWLRRWSWPQVHAAMLISSVLSRIFYGQLISTQSRSTRSATSLRITSAWIWWPAKQRSTLPSTIHYCDIVDVHWFGDQTGTYDARVWNFVNSLRIMTTDLHIFLSSYLQIPRVLSFFYYLRTGCQFPDSCFLCIRLALHLVFHCIIERIITNIFLLTRSIMSGCLTMQARTLRNGLFIYIYHVGLISNSGCMPLCLHEMQNFCLLVYSVSNHPN